MDPSEGFSFVEDRGTNERMNEVMKIINYHPKGINFNKLVELSKSYVSRDTLRDWLKTFESYNMIQRKQGLRRGQEDNIKPTKEYEHWENLRNTYNLRIGRVKKKTEDLVKKTDRFATMDMFEIYMLLLEMERLPFRCYFDGRTYSDQIADRLRDDADKIIKPLYKSLKLIISQQESAHQFDYNFIEDKLDIISNYAPRLVLADNSKLQEYTKRELERAKHQLVIHMS